MREKFETAAREGEAPVLVTSAGIRPFVRGIVERFRAQTPVISQSGNSPAGAVEDGRQHLDAKAAVPVRPLRYASLVAARDRSFQSAPCFCQFIRM